MRLAAFLLSVAVFLGISLSLAAPPKSFVGSAACEGCHQKEYSSFSKFAKKSHSFKSIQIMAPKLEPNELKECYSCHTTGYGQPGGFVSLEKTPALANAGCEVCHGPGSVHAESGDKKDIVAKPKVEDCQTCHNEQRVKSFGFKPMLYGGAH
jgi:hypothetical protein